MGIIPENEKKPSDRRRVVPPTERSIKPFLKWAGGKGQLLGEIEKLYPFKERKFTKYAEPFVGGGAVLFDILGKFELDEIYISDINAELINAYQILRDNVNSLVDRLAQIQEEYLPLEWDERKIYFMTKRDRFNEGKIKGGVSATEKAALMIFLNKTCFNGLYRVNRKGFFNVPVGSYKKPTICDEENLLALSAKLKNVQISCCDYQKSADFIDDHTFVYFDPPYRPLSQTASFTAYTEVLFNDSEQKKLALFVEEMHQKGARVVVSNSDPKNINDRDDFFDQIYSCLEIKRVSATRMINCNSNARGRIQELLIFNF